MKTTSEHLKTHKNRRRLPKRLLKILMDPSKALSSTAITSFIYVQYLETRFNHDIRLHIPEQDVPEKGVFAGSVSKKNTYAQGTHAVCLKIISIKICRIKESDTIDSQAWHIEKDLLGTVDCLQASDLGVSLTRFCIALQGFTKLAVASERSPNPSPILHYASGLKHRTATSYLAIVCWRTTSRQERCPTRKDRYR